MVIDHIESIRSRITEIQERFESYEPSAISASSESNESAPIKGSGFSKVLETASNSSSIPATGGKYDSVINEYASKYKVDPLLVKAVIHAESGFNSRAVSSCGAEGLMQLMPSTARGLGVTDSMDPVQNIAGGTRYLRYLLDKFGGNTSKTVAAYNAGPGSVQKYGGVPPYTETQNYVKRVIGYLQKMRENND